jgi:ribosomal protein S9
MAARRKTSSGTVQARMRLADAFKATGTEGTYDVRCSVSGGGLTGQSERSCSASRAP